MKRLFARVLLALAATGLAVAALTACSGKASDQPKIGFSIDDMEGLIRQAYRRYDFAVSVAAVGLAAAASIWLTRFGGPLATVWIANGLAIAALMRRGGEGMLRFLAITTAMVWLLGVLGGFSALNALNLTLVNALEIGWVVRMLSGSEGVTYLEQPLGVQRFIVWAVVVAPVVTSALAAPVHALETGASVWLTLGMRSCSHALGNEIGRAHV